MGGVLVVWGLILIPMWATAPAQEPVPLAIGQLIACGVILGVGRQGIDVLLLRLLAASMALVVGGQLQTQTPPCGSSLHCVQVLLNAMIVLGVFGTSVLALVALPTSIIWVRGIAALRPELPWRRVPIPNAWWQWALLLAGLIAITYLLLFVMQIPEY